MLGKVVANSMCDSYDVMKGKISPSNRVYVEDNFRIFARDVVKESGAGSGTNMMKYKQLNKNLEAIALQKAMTQFAEYDSMDLPEEYPINLLDYGCARYLVADAWRKLFYFVNLRAKLIEPAVKSAMQTTGDLIDHEVDVVISLYGNKQWFKLAYKIMAYTATPDFAFQFGVILIKALKPILAWYDWILVGVAVLFQVAMMAGTDGSFTVAELAAIYVKDSGTKRAWSDF